MRRYLLVFIGVFLAGTLCGLALAVFVDLDRPAEPAIAYPVAVVSPAPVAATTSPSVVEETPTPELLPELPPPHPPIEAQGSPDPVPAVEEPALPIPAESTAPTSATGLLLPVEGIKASQLSDNFTDSRGSGRTHEAIDIMAPKGTLVFAVDDGRIVKLFKSVPGGLTIYHFDPTEKMGYYYAHLDRYAADLVEGRQVKRGEVIGYVGSTGNASATAPHLHFAIFMLGPEKRWWEGTAINPYPLLTGKQQEKIEVTDKEKPR